MKTATFEFGKQPLADWIAENRDCEKMHLPENLKYIRFAAFVGLWCDDVKLPQSVEVLESWSIGGQYKTISLPKSLKDVAYDFYYEEMIDDPEEWKPYVDIHPDNPVYYSKNGILYSRATGKEVLGKAGREQYLSEQKKEMRNENKFKF